MTTHLTEFDIAVQLLADGIRDGARNYGINDIVTGSRHILAERGLRKLLEQFTITRKQLTDEVSE
jgi:hypothetical protein